MIVARRRGIVEREKIHALSRCSQKRRTQAKKIRIGFDVGRTETGGQSANADVLNAGDEQTNAGKTLRKLGRDAQQHFAARDLILVGNAV